MIVSNTVNNTMVVNNTVNFTSSWTAKSKDQEGKIG